MEKNFNIRTTENGMFIVDYYTPSSTPESCGMNHSNAFVESKLVPETPA